MRERKARAILEHINESFRIKEDILPYISTPLHYHPHYELVWIKKGFGIRVVGDHIDQFKEGDMVLMGPNLPHTWENDKIYYEEGSTLKVDVYVLHFMDEIITYLHRFPELSGIKDILAQSQRGLCITGTTNHELSKIIKQLFVSSSIERIILFLRVFQLLENSKDIALLSSSDFAHFFSEQKSDRLRKVYEFMSKNFDRNIQIEEVSNIACMSPTAFCRYFKQKTGQSFISYLNNFRLGYARNLLNGNKYKISIVAEKCGFQDISYFNRMFKQKNNMTPTEYIQLIHGE